MAIEHRIRPKFKTRNEAIVAKLRAETGAGAPIDPAMKVKRLTAEVAIQMALLHGGDWMTKIDHQEGLVLVARAGTARTS